MFLLRKPSAKIIQSFLATQLDQTFSYREIGASHGAAPAGYTVDHHRIRLGEGLKVFELAVTAVRDWKMLCLDWVELYWHETPISAGATVALLVHHFAFWSLNACRIVYLVEEDNHVGKFGFAYGTLPEHAERGEERFTVEWHHDDNSVWYDILAFSQPNHILAKIGYPLTRTMQKRFAKDSAQAMIQATKTGSVNINDHREDRLIGD